MTAGSANHTREVQSQRDAPPVVREGTENPHARAEVAHAQTTPHSHNRELAKLPSNQAARDAIPPMQIVSGDKPITGGAEQVKPEGHTPYPVQKLAPEDKKWTDSRVQNAGKGMAYDISHEGNMGPKGGMGELTHGDQFSAATSTRVQGLLDEAEQRGGAKGVEDMSKRINDSFQKAQKEDKRDFPNGPEKDFKLTGQTLTRADVQIVDRKNPYDHADTSYRLNQ